MGNRAVSPHKVLSFLLTVVPPLAALPFAVTDARAQSAPAAVDFAIAPQPLASALIEYSKQAHVQVLTAGANLENAQSPGVSGKHSAATALHKLLQGTAFGSEFTDASTVVVKPAAPRPATAEPAAKAAAPKKNDDPPQEPPAELQKLTVTGSHIPRAQVEGPAPITTITSDDIRRAGFGSVPDVLKSLTQNGGETQSQQSASGAHFTPGAAQVDLRGLGPNHTLVLVNGRRIADFPFPFQGTSNFTDVASIPLAMIDRVEVLSGSASAIYGSDAIAGVVNFILKTQVDGIALDYRAGTTEHGGGSSNRLQLASGWSAGDFSMVLGGELLDQKPLWAYDRNIQDSTADNPTTAAPLGRRTFLRYDPIEDMYVDPGRATCDALSWLNRGSTYYASRPNYGLPDGEGGYGPGYFCGSDKSIGYGTILSKRRSANLFTSLNYRLNDSFNFFTDLQYGYSNTKVFRDVLAWDFQDANGSSDGVFFNRRTGALDSWSRQFTPEEMGGLENGYIRNVSHNYTLTSGLKGLIGESDWSYEASFNHSQYTAKAKFPAIIAGRANDLYLGPQLGVDEDTGYPIFDADPARLYRPLTPAEYASISSNIVDKAKSRAENWSLTLNNPSLFELPAGPVGFALVGEFGNQAYEINPDQRALVPYFYSIQEVTGAGSRSHWGTAYEFRVPVFESLLLSTAGRYDKFEYGQGGDGKFTWSLGLEWRPFDSLLVRGSAGTGFRAPDLHYLFAGPSGFHTNQPDYYRCRTEEPDEPIGDCSYGDETILGRRNGNQKLESETSKSATFGFVYSPASNIDFSIDYFNIRMSNAVLDLNINTLLQTEADCRIGQTANGTPIDINSPTCQAAIARVRRYAADNPVNPNGLEAVSVNPINVARERTSGLDLAGHYRLDTDRLGSFDFRLGYTLVIKHESQQYPGDPTVNQFDVDSGYDIPRTKSSATATWTYDRFTTTLHGQRLGHLPNYDEDGRINASTLYNATIGYRFNDRARLTFTVDNLFDTKPRRDKGYASYPYYDISWFDAVGRQFFVDFNYRFGGSEP